MQLLSKDTAKDTTNGKTRFAFPVWMKLGIVGLIIAIVGGGIFAFVNLTATTPEAGPVKFVAVPVNPQIEEKWGIRVSQIGVTADGGMVDFRFVVTDPDKALELMSKADNLPILATEDNKTYINSAALMSPRHALNPGTTYFMLYRNTKGAVKPGTAVTVLFPDELKLEHVVAR